VLAKCAKNPAKTKERGEKDSDACCRNIHTTSKETRHMGFELNRVCPGVTHIRDAMGVCMTLIEGERAALLVDTGYGTEDMAAFIRSLTDKPLTVLLTHNHHDHAMGARWFEKTMMFPEDIAEWHVFTGEAKRRVVLSQAFGKGLPVTEADFLAGEFRLPLPANKGAYNLGGVTAEVIPCPGHTPGSCVVYVPERRLIITGDNWNPCTWLFFEAALPVRQYRENVRKLLELDFEHVLCSHQLECFPRSKFEAFMNGLTDEILDAAKPVTIGGYEHINTRQADVAEGQILVFDWNKYKEA
jgi:glyoxylase-like metal-dependent hydrolase (beta-lactamase superfamily II)